MSGTQFPYPSGYYPVGQLTDVGGLAVFFATQFPLLNVNPDAHVTDDDGGRQFPNPSVWYPDGQSDGSGFDTTTGIQFPSESG